MTAVRGSTFAALALIATFGSTTESVVHTTCLRPGSPARMHTDSRRLDVQSPAPVTRRLISKVGIGGVRLGTTLDEARQALPTARFERASDGDGMALVEVTLAPGESIVLWAGEDDPKAPIDWTRRIRTLETFNPAFRTPEGVRPGSLVTDVEKALGRVREIVKSEIESREYVEFDRQPPHLTFRLDYTGIFPDEGRRTTKYDPRARILSIAVSSNPPR